MTLLTRRRAFDDANVAASTQPPLAGYAPGVYDDEAELEGCRCVRVATPSPGRRRRVRRRGSGLSGRAHPRRDAAGVAPARAAGRAEARQAHLLRGVGGEEGAGHERRTRVGGAPVCVASPPSPCRISRVVTRPAFGGRQGVQYSANYRRIGDHVGSDYKAKGFGLARNEAAVPDQTRGGTWGVFRFNCATPRTGSVPPNV